MRTTKKITKSVTTVKNSNLVSDVSSPTPIQIVLKIDEKGMVSLKSLYEFLQINLSNYSKWCKRNIVNNPFATEGIDYICIYDENGKHIGGRPSYEYKLTLDFAKQLSMTVKNEQAQQAVQYFIACEQGLKLATQKFQDSIDITQITKAMTSISQAIAVLANNISTMQQDIQGLKQSQKNRYLSKKGYPSAWYKKIAPKYKMLMEYFNCSRNELYSSIYKELEDIHNVDIDQIYDDYCYENHLSKEECYPMDAIEYNTKLRNALTSLIDNSLIKYGLQTEEEIKNFKRKTLFDMKPEDLEKRFRINEE